MDRGRILYVQYTNPAGYPPLEHSSRILADDGWQILFLGTGAAGAGSLRLPAHPNIRVRKLAFCEAGWRQKLHYLYFCMWVVCRGSLWRPDWVYASDLLSCPAALVLSYLPGMRTIYHEHDSPDTADSTRSRFIRFALWTRRALACRSEFCVLPNQRRWQRFNEEMGPSRGFCVWNCPRKDEVLPERFTADACRVWLIYHGSLVPSRLPLTILDAMAVLPDSVALRVIGYETVGSRGDLAAFQERARTLGILPRLEILGTLQTRAELLEWCRRSHIGLALMPRSTTEINQLSMVGASNKAFDYMASGLAVLVSDLPDWRLTYVDNGYALACDPEDPESIAAAVRLLLDDPERMRGMGEKGRTQILSLWNYEEQFRPVMQALESRRSSQSHGLA